MPEPIPRTSIYLSLLRFSLVAGALYDLALAVLLVLVPELPARLLEVPRPGEDFYLWLIAVLLVMVSALYLLAAYDPEAYWGNVVVAIAGRGAAGAVLLATAAGRADLAGLYPLAAADLLFAAAHAAFWWPAKR